MTKNKKPVIIFGPPRSGTTWLANVLSANEETTYIHEPDNEKNNYLAYILKNKLRRFPYIKENEKEVNYLKLFDLSLSGKPLPNESKLNALLMKIADKNKEKIEKEIPDKPNKTFRIRLAKLVVQLKNLHASSNKRRIIKSVHAHLSIPFLQKHLNFTPFIIVRHPAAVIASHMKLKMPDADRKIFNDPKIKNDFLVDYQSEINELETALEYFALQISIFHHILNIFINKFSYDFITHEELCKEPLERFKSIYKKLGLTWNSDVEQFIIKHNQQGKDGYDIYRNCEAMNQKWKKTFSKEQSKQIEKAYTILPNDFGYSF